MLAPLALVFVLAGAQDPVAAAAATTPPAATDTVFSFAASDGTTLDAKLTLPAERQGRVPVVFYLHGAGPRTFDNPFSYLGADGKPARANYLDYHAAELAQRGIAFCRINKRGCFPREDRQPMRVDRAVFAQTTPGVLLDDYDRGLAALRARDEIDADQIVLLGSSEGTWMAPRLAKQSPDGIRGIAMVGYAADNTRDTVVWQNSVGPWRGIQHLVPEARDGVLTKSEYDAAAAANAAVRQIAFAALDADKDEILTPEELATAVKPLLDLLLQAAADGDDAVLLPRLQGLSAAYLKEWWDAEPNHVRLLELDVPLAIFHGDLDNTCRVEGAREAEAAFAAANRTNLTVHYFADGDHDLNWSWATSQDGGPPAYRSVFAWISGCFDS